MNSEEPKVSTITSDTMFLKESTFSEREQSTISMLSSEKNQDVQKCFNINSWIKVEPEEVDTVTTNCEVTTVDIINLNKKVDQFLAVFYNKEQWLE